MKKKLLLATNVFPYQSGEVAFVIPELKRLKKNMTSLSFRMPVENKARRDT